MHFSKTYSQILLTLPPELRDNAIQYRQLKKLINQVVVELSAHGLSPAILQDLLDASPSLDGSDLGATPTQAKAIYEFHVEDERIEPRLRLWVNNTPQSHDHLDEPSNGEPSIPEPVENSQESSNPQSTAHEPYTHEVVIPLVSDTAFFELLTSALQALATHLLAVQNDFMATLKSLAVTIASTSHPMSATSSSFRPHSSLSNPAASLSQSIFAHSKNDLYAWREIFQLYMDAEVFESAREASRGEVSAEDSETRLRLFIDQMKERGLSDGRKLKMQESRVALKTFVELNLLILSVKKFQVATTEATRKILKKHTKRTALPLPSPTPSTSTSSTALTTAPPSVSQPQGLPFSFAPPGAITLPRVLVQALGETLLPVIPHIDDYSCLICTSIAFKPIRLTCGHLFCVRCLVKMQKRGNGDCPMCRAPSVLVANRSNVDWALLNFMQDWFPQETKAKLKHNEREAAQEELIEMGVDPNQSCLVM
ncbi:hypothetical protein HGRIS_014194 [Hohenbuehelia grisea]|uniref:RING-14 protein n=1 Tax=Hohenbuehelia grisea TaxID=104357 RepID=A0ABR3JSL6_9AGAR